MGGRSHIDRARPRRHSYLGVTIGSQPRADPAPQQPVGLHTFSVHMYVQLAGKMLGEPAWRCVLSRVRRCFLEDAIAHVTEEYMQYRPLWLRIGCRLARVCVEFRVS